MQGVWMRVAGAGRGMRGWWQRVCRVKTSGGEIGKWGLGGSLLLVCHVRLPLGTPLKSSVEMWLCKDLRSPVDVSLWCVWQSASLALEGREAAPEAQLL